MISDVKDSVSRLLKEDTGAYRHLVRTHSGITIGIWTALFILSYLAQFLAPEGGLSNLGMHGLIFTIQVSLIILGLLLTPFWEAGLSYVALDFIRGRRNISADLPQGFRRLKPMSGYLLFFGIQCVLVYFFCRSATSVVLTLLPLPQGIYEDITTLLLDPSTPLKGRMLISSGIYCLVFLGLAGFLLFQIFYRYRMARYIILDDDAMGGVKAASQSRTLMKRNKKMLFLLDLSYWWFYIAELLGIVLPLGVLLIDILDISLPPRLKIAAWAIAAFGLVLRLMVRYFAKPKIAAVYALFYERLLKQEEEPIVEDVPPQSAPKKPSKPDKVPWKY